MLLELGKFLCRDHVETRLQNVIGLRTNQVQMMQKFLGIEDVPAPLVPAEGYQNKRCDICKKDGKVARLANKARQQCINCRKLLCKKHIAQTVARCAGCNQ